MDRAYLLNWTNELSERCTHSDEFTAGCLRGLERTVKSLSGREGHLAFESEIGPQARIALDGEGRPIFQISPLVFVEYVSEYAAKRSALLAVSPKYYSHTEREAQRNYLALASTHFVSALVWKSAFDWVNGRVADDESAKKVLIHLINGQRKEIDADPYSFVRLRRVPKPNLENRPMSVEYFDGKYFVSKVRPTSKADLAGVRVGMQLKGIGEQALTPSNLNSSLEQFAKDPSLFAHFAGPEGNVLDIPYWGKEKPLPGVHSYILPMKKGPVGVIEILTFNAVDVCSSVRLHLIKLRNENVKALIIDLRHNTGGMVEPVRCIGGSLFGENKLMVHMKALREDGLSYELRSNSTQILKDIPKVILIDAATASTSEILAGSAREISNAWIVGLRSFGKGIAQDVTPLYIDGDLVDGFDSLRTTLRFEFPSGYSPQLRGIQPDLVVGSSIRGIDGESMAVRFEDRFGNAFKGEEPDPLPDGDRMKRLKWLKACVARSQMGRFWLQNAELSRWFSDRQLRVAGLAAQCEMGRQLRAAEISPKRL